MSSETETLLFLAARAQLVQELLQPALAQGKVVVSDRYADSTLAYQGYGRGLDVDILRRLNSFATGGLGPRLTVLLDLSVEEAGRRRGPQPQDRFEAAGSDGAAFHSRVRQGFLDLAQEEPERWLVVDATRSRREVARAVWERVAPLLAA
jgi:dTMP kinase